MTMKTDTPGAGTLPKQLFGYEVIDFIGQGAGSLIYVVYHPQTKQLYALKHVVRRTEKDERFMLKIRDAQRIDGRPGQLRPGDRRQIRVARVRLRPARVDTRAAARLRRGERVTPEAIYLDYAATTSLSLNGGTISDADNDGDALAAAQAQGADTARDRQSILAMQGEYQVDFAFDETELLQPGYERQAAMRSAES